MIVGHGTDLPDIGTDYDRTPAYVRKHTGEGLASLVHIDFGTEVAAKADKAGMG